MKKGVIIQARTSSTRLSRKVLKELPFNSKITVLQQVIRRTLKVSLVDEVVVVTTTDAEDEEIIRIAEKEGVKSFKGSREDVLSRYYFAAKENKLDIIVRVTSDCPCIDWKIIENLIKKIVEDKKDFIRVKGYPRGTADLEVLTFKTLETAFHNSTKDYEREHVCPYIYKTNPSIFDSTELIAPEDLHYPDIRVTLDTLEDYTLLCAVFDYLYDKNNFFDTTDIINLFKDKPWLKAINSNVVQKEIL